ncbi:MAG: DUF4307 domain-containing protein [Nocardioidaceae bacterium]
MTQTAPELTHRYGAPGPVRRRLAVGLVVALAVLGLGWTAWTAWLHATPEVTSGVTSYGVRGEHSITVSFTVVRRDATVRARCALQAVAADHSIVGALTVTVGPGGATSSTVTRAVRTDRAATSVNLLGCTAPGQRQAQ